jgi:hypothetical protein
LFRSSNQTHALKQIYKTAIAPQVHTGKCRSKQQESKDRKVGKNYTSILDFENEDNCDDE